MLIETINLSKIYPGGCGCRDISLEVAEGEVFGLLGPNGAGKSTFVKMLLGLVEPTSGSARILDRPLGDVKARQEISFLPENFRYHDWMTAREVLHYHGSLSGLSPREIRVKIPEVMEKVKLGSIAEQRISTFSKGMQQRLGLAASLLNRPRLIFLDEPTSALDPIGRRHVRVLIQELRGEGTTIFLNSHLLSEVEQVSDRVAVIKEGKLIAEGRLEAMLKTGVEVEIQLGSINDALLDKAEAFCTSLSVSGTKLNAALAEESSIPQLVQALVQAGGQLYSVTPYKSSLEELFVKLIGEEEKTSA